MATFCGCRTVVIWPSKLAMDTVDMCENETIPENKRMRHERMHRVPNFRVAKDHHVFCQECSASGGVDQESSDVFVVLCQEQEEHCQMLKAKCTDIEYDAEVCKEQEVEKRKPLRPQPPRVFSEDDSRGLLVSAWQSASSQRCSNKLAKIW